MFRITYSGNKHSDYSTLDEAREIANEIAERTNIIVGIVEIENPESGMNLRERTLYRQNNSPRKRMIRAANAGLR